MVDFQCQGERVQSTKLNVTRFKEVYLKNYYMFIEQRKKYFLKTMKFKYVAWNAMSIQLQIFRIICILRD